MSARTPVEQAQESRTEFERIVAMEAGFVRLDLSTSDGRYINDSINRQWEIWQTALAWADAYDADRALIAALTEALRAYVLAQSRMLDKWAEGDENVKRDLWRNLHACEDAARAALSRAEKEGV